MHLKVAGKAYRLSTRPENEEAYRLAESEVNAYINNFRKGNYKGWEDRDYIAMAALHLAIANVQLRQQREATSDDMRKLEEMNEKLDRFLNNIKR